MPKNSENLSLKSCLKSDTYYATGRRKTATARTWIAKGSGRIIVNKQDVTRYFARQTLRMIINQPFAAIEQEGQYDVWCTIKGSGLSGQAGALRHGISRALDKYNPEFRIALKKDGLLTRDAREVERKKYGLHKARKRTQYSKR